MAINSNVTFDIVRFLESRWTSFIGMIATWIVLSCVSWLLLSEIQCISKSQLLTIIFIMFPTTFLFWCIQTKRWFQRSGYSALCVYLLILLLTFFFHDVVYPLTLEGKKNDFLYAQFLVSLFVFIVFLVFAYICYFHIGKHKTMCIVFLVSDHSTHEVDIMKALNAARHKLEQKAPNIQVIIPPFGIANSIKQAEQYINGHFNQADAVIYAKLIDSNEGEKFGYAFTHFTSRCSNRYIKSDNNSFIVDDMLRVTHDGHNWNTLNIKKDSIAQTMEVAENLEHLYLMYVCCLYMYKHQYADAVKVTKHLYEFAPTGNSEFDDFVKNLIAETYIIAARVEEHQNHNFLLARQILNDCASKLPLIEYTLCYKLANARLLYYESNIKESKRVTKSIKDKDAEWYVSVNMAFYALVERKPYEVYSYYKRLLKLPHPDKDEVEFVIHFLENEKRESFDDQYHMFLLHGLAYLYLYVDPRKSEKALSNLNSYHKIIGFEELDKMRGLIQCSKGKLRVKGRPQHAYQTDNHKTSYQTIYQTLSNYQ